MAPSHFGVYMKTPHPLFGLGSADKLKSKVHIDALFAGGFKVKRYPFLMVYLPREEEDDASPVRMGFSVSKRRFKRAVDRNRVKRLMREVYRLNKQAFFNSIQAHGVGANAMLVYIGRDLPVYSDLEGKISGLLTRWDATLLQHAPQDSADEIAPIDPPQSAENNDT